MAAGATSYGPESVSFFFFQAEDGIRDVAVTGVQTCALPISAHLLRQRRFSGRGRLPTSRTADRRSRPEVPHGRESPFLSRRGPAVFLDDRQDAGFVLFVEGRRRPLGARRRRKAFWPRLGFREAAQPGSEAGPDRKADLSHRSLSR